VIDGEVRRLLDEARSRVSETLMAHRATLDRLAGVLLEKEVIDRHTLDELLRSAGSKPSTVASTAATTT